MSLIKNFFLISLSCLAFGTEALSTPPGNLDTSYAPNIPNVTSPENIVFIDFMNSDPNSNFKRSRDAYALRLKAKGYIVTVIVIKEPDDLKKTSDASKILSDLNLTDNTKIIIEGHGSPGRHFIGSDVTDTESGKKNKYSSDDIATFLNNGTPGIKSLHVTVESCSSGLGIFEKPDRLHERTESFAENLLKKLGKTAQVVGTNGITVASPTGSQVRDPKFSYRNRLDYLNELTKQMHDQMSRITEEAMILADKIINLENEDSDLSIELSKLEKTSISTKSKLKSQRISGQIIYISNRKNKIQDELEQIHKKTDFSLTKIENLKTNYDLISAEIKSIRDSSSTEGQPTYTTYSVDDSERNIAQHNHVLWEELKGSTEHMKHKMTVNEGKEEELLAKKKHQLKAEQDSLVEFRKLNAVILKKGDISRYTEKEDKERMGKINKIQNEVASSQEKLNTLRESRTALENSYAAILKRSAANPDESLVDTLRAISDVETYSTPRDHDVGQLGETPHTSTLNPSLVPPTNLNNTRAATGYTPQKPHHEFDTGVEGDENKNFTRAVLAQ